MSGKTVKSRKFCYMAVICVYALCCLGVIGYLCMKERESRANAWKVEIATERESKKITTDIPGDTLGATIAEFPMEIDELFRIAMVYTPSSANVDFGFIAPDGLFYSTAVKNGNFSKTIEVDQRGFYAFAVRNNSPYTISISGFLSLESP